MLATFFDFDPHAQQSVMLRQHENVESRLRFAGCGRGVAAQSDSVAGQPLENLTVRKLKLFVIMETASMDVVRVR